MKEKKIIADLHVHGRYSRATSKQLDLDNLEKYARIKGINLLGTGDFTHPDWLAHLKEKLIEDGKGLLKSSSGFSFVLQTELSLIYTQGGKGRRVHMLLLAPTIETVEQINEQLKKWGRTDYDGRPIFNKSCIELIEAMKKISDKIEIIPAHIWTPWFSLFGAKSGFNSIKEALGEYHKKVHALETGLSSDPKMNWRVSQIKDYHLVSFSDLHSFWPWRIGREATIFKIKPSYDELIKALRNKEDKKIEKTIEFWPEEGKYHYDGHRKCGICLKPKEAIKLKNICPVCKRPLTKGVAHRIEELADKEEGYQPKNSAEFKNLIPLSELIAGHYRMGVNTKKVWQDFNKLIKNFGNELKILLEIDKRRLNQVVSPGLAKLILKNREAKIPFKAGFDGEYGKPIFEQKEKSEREEEKMKEEKIEQRENKKFKKQTSISDF